MKLNFYRVYGLTVESEIELPNLFQVSGNDSDIRIRIAPVPDSIPNVRDSGVFYQAGPNDFLFHMDQVGRFRVQNGDEILIDQERRGNSNLENVFLLGSVFGALLHQRGILALHGSAVSIPDGALIIAGPSSSGKSTLAAALAQKGFTFLADDISAIYHHGNSMMVHHGIPQMKLWRDSKEKLFKEEEFTRFRPEIEKYSRHVPHMELQPRLVRYVLILGAGNRKDVSMNEIKGLEKFEFLRTNTYRFRFLNGLGMTQRHFSAITNLAQNTRVYKVERPSSPFMLDDLIHAIEQRIIP